MASLKRHFGWLMIDHSASPGIPRDIAMKLGLPPDLVAEGKRLETDTISCSHCGGHVARLYITCTRASAPSPEYCKRCDHYICRECSFEMTQPGYQHRNKFAIADAAMTSASRGQLFDPATPKPISIIVP